MSVKLLQVLGVLAHDTTPTTADRFEAFEQELQRARRDNGWGSHPWRKATDPERFLAHVERMAEGFTTGGGDYAARLSN